MLGRMFTLHRGLFWNRVRNAAEDIRRGLVEFGLNHRARACQEQFSTSAYESLYFSGDSSAYVRQEIYPDSDDDDASALMMLLRSLRLV